MTSNETVVVGGGVAGLTAAAYLGRAGHHALLLEKEGETGGLVRTFWREGFAFDAGARALGNAGILFPMLNHLGLSPDFQKNPVTIGIGERRIRMDRADSLEQYGDMLRSYFPERADDIVKITDRIADVTHILDVIYGIDNPLFRDDWRDVKYLTGTLFPWLLRYGRSMRKIRRMTGPVTDYLADLTEDRALCDMITQHFFKGTPAFFALGYFGLYSEYVYPKGGTGQLTGVLTDFARSKDVTIATDCDVCAIDANRHRLTLDDGRKIGYGRLIWAADQATFYRCLKNEDQNRAVTRMRHLTSHAKAADSVLTLFLGTSCEPSYFLERGATHLFFTPEPYGLGTLNTLKSETEKDGMLQWLGHYLERTTYEISCPVLRDSTLAPPGCTGVIVSTLMDYDDVHRLCEHMGDDAFKAYCSKKIIDVLERSIFSDLGNRVRFSICSTPMTIERHTGNRQGGLNGWSFENDVIPAEHRFTRMAKAIDHPVPDVVQCGQWTFSPAGVPTCILTGKLAADACCGRRRAQ